MNIGDIVRLKDSILNNEKWLDGYRGLIGTIVDRQLALYNPTNEYVRVYFKKMKSYEDFASWRVTKV